MDKVDEGPFVDITGTYDTVRKQPVFAVDKIYHQKDPVLHVSCPGGMEHFMLMGLPREPVMFRTVRQVVRRSMACVLPKEAAAGCTGLSRSPRTRRGMP